jgi:hypothetical protein
VNGDVTQWDIQFAPPVTLETNLKAAEVPGRVPTAAAAAAAAAGLFSG